MNPILKQLVIDTLTRKLNKKPKDFNAYSEGELEKGLVAFKGTLLGYFKDFLFITAGVFSAAFGFKGFLLTNHFIDGGATGISLLISAITSIPLAILLVVVNIPFILLGYRIMGKSFALKTALAISGLALVVATISFPNITNDNLLVALFGGFFLGAGIGLSVRGGAVIDGTEVLAIFLSRKFGTTMGDVIIMINVLIFGTAAYFLSVEIALYSMVTYLSASKTLDFVIEGIEEYTGVTIVSPLNEEIRDVIINKLGHGVTMYNGKGGYGKMGESKNIEIIYTVVTRLELNKLNEAINNIDPEAFVVMSSIKDTKGGMIKKRPLDH
jgi:uncharacterized membrane-anchored protein YitT (DUF2179 family)